MAKFFSEEHRRRISEAQLRRYRENPELRRAVSESKAGNSFRAGKPTPPDACRSISEKMKTIGGRNWRGGEVGDAFAAVLCPAGFVREYHLYFGPNNSRSHVLDFAHIEGKVNIELDGPMHVATPEEDAQRDAVLKTLGWKVIRITHP